MPSRSTSPTPADEDFWDSRVGPFYDAAGAAALTRMTPSELALCVAAGDVLEVTTSHGTPLYPSFQFGPRGDLLPALRVVTHALLPISDDLWDVALWLSTPTQAFDGRSAIEILKAGDTDPVVALAHRDARRLTGP
jgi:hypothetical protein